MSTNPDAITRRRFIGQSACAALGTTGLLSTLLNIGVASRCSAANPREYKAMICLFFLGGNDSFNNIIPISDEEYKFYTEIRGGLHNGGAENGSGLALALNTLHPIEPKNIAGRPFGLHPGLGPIQQLFNAGQLSYVANVGSLREPFENVAQYRKERAKWPLGLFSHSDQQQQWQTCMPDVRSGIGWAGRAMDILSKQQDPARRSTFNVSLSGMNILQTGREIVPYTMNTRGLVGLTGYDEKARGDSRASLQDQVILARTKAVDSMMQGVYYNVFERTYAKVTKGAQDTFEQLQFDLKDDAFPDWAVNEDSPQLEQQLKMIANVINAYKDSGVRRQTFFVSLGGFDMHAELVNSQAALLPIVGDAIGKFWQHMPEKTKPNVTLFSASDFARTLTGNGQGSDHAWGGNHFVLGGAVNGGQVFGDYPIFAASSLADIDVGQGRLIPSYSVEEYLYPTLKWFGVSDRDIFEQVFPGYAKRFGTGGVRKTYPLYKAGMV